MAESSALFLTAHWRDLLVINYSIDPRILSGYTPAGTELDLWNGQAYISIVGFMFLNTRLLGIPLPFHRNFEEINLRFYVRRNSGGGGRRGVCFVRELVPRRAIAAVARLAYNENYSAVPMAHRLEEDLSKRSIEYSWNECGARHFISAVTEGPAQDLSAGSLDQFILEHYWGYAAQRNGSTVEYRVEHPPWRVWTPGQINVQCGFEQVYGRQFAETLSRPPVSAVVAEGSNVTVCRPVNIGC